jgi:hypothetical protein
VNRAAVPLVAWAALQTALALVLWVWTSDDLPPAILGAAAVIAWALGVYALLRPPARPRVHAAPDLSLSSALVALAIAMLTLGALVGPWLVYIGAGALLIGLIGVGRELLAERRLR